MRNILWYYYQIRSEKITESNGEYNITSENGQYVFKELKIPIDVLKNIAEILYFNQINAQLLVINKNGELETEYNGKMYVLVKKIEFFRDYNYIDLTNVEVNVDRNNIGELWSRKIDYYMFQLKQMGINKETLINSFNYYVGMAENAISMANRINEKNVEFKYVVQHARMKSNFTANDYYDPTLMIIDLRVRDVSEYIKDKFFSDSIDIKSVIGMVEKYGFDENEMNMLYARLFYPTYYFDLYEDMIIDEEEEQKIIKIINKREEYEKLLSEFYEYFKKYVRLYEIEWIKKEL